MGINIATPVLMVPAKKMYCQSQEAAESPEKAIGLGLNGKTKLYDGEPVNRLIMK